MPRDIEKLYDEWFESVGGQETFEYVHEKYPDADSNYEDYDPAFEVIRDRFIAWLSDLEHEDMTEDEDTVIHEIIDAQLT